MAGTSTYNARAKINLALHVTGRRDDGYHDIETLVVFAEFGDRLTATPSATDAFDISGPYGRSIPPGTENLVIRARDALRAALPSGAAPPVSIRLEKNLPPASGIGGGSSDAAAALLELQRLWPCVDEMQPLFEIGLSLGADVPMCLTGKPLVARGIGDRIEPVDRIAALHLVLVNPGVEVATPGVFRALERRDNPPLPALPDGSDACVLVDWLAAGTRNDLQAPAEGASPEISTALTALIGAGARLARMSGSGATCFGIFSGPDDALVAARAIRRDNPGWFVAATRTGGAGQGA